jgi:hypothetical protein
VQADLAGDFPDDRRAGIGRSDVGQESVYLKTGRGLITDVPRAIRLAAFSRFHGCSLASSLIMVMIVTGSAALQTSTATSMNRLPCNNSGASQVPVAVFIVCETKTNQQLASCRKNIQHSRVIHIGIIPTFINVRVFT